MQAVGLVVFLVARYSPQMAGFVDLVVPLAVTLYGDLHAERG